MHRFSVFLLTVIMSVPGVSTQALADRSEAILNFRMTFVGGGCEIGAPADIVFNDGTPLSSDDVKNNVAATRHDFVLTLTHCEGWGLTPKITVRGPHASDVDTPLFRNSGGEKDAVGYGILLATPGNQFFQANKNLAANGTISVNEKWSKETQLNTLDSSVPMSATVSCGDCKSASRRGGSLSATVTFNFVYD